MTIHDERDDRWRAVDEDGNFLDILVQRRRDQTAANTVFHKRLKGLTDVARVLLTDQRNRDGTAIRERFAGVAHRQHRSLNN
ncbi:MAG: DDE-type integrase/transposase/recombinase [Candidatus Entotheonellia bacterium]